MNILSFVKSKYIRYLCLIFFVVALLTTAPYMYGYKIAGPGKVFTGVHSINSGDTYSYLSWIQQAREGNIFFEDKYTTEDQSKIYINPVFLLLGLVAKYTTLSNIFVYHIARIILIGFVIVITYKLVHFLIDDKKKSLLVVLFFCFASGFGWFFGYFSTDLWMVELIPFLTFYESVLNMIGIVLVLSTFLFFLSSIRSNKPRLLLLAGLCANLLILTHTYDILIVFTILGSYSIYKIIVAKQEQFLRAFIIFITLTIPGILWTFFVLLRNPALGVWATQQSYVPSPSIFWYVSGFGMLGILALFGIKGLAADHEKKEFFYFWFAALMMLLYLPLNRFQRKFSLTLFVPLSVMGVYGLVSLINQTHFANKRLAKILSAILVLILGFVTNFYVIFSDISLYQAQQYPYYIEQDEKVAIDWLKSNNSSVVLTGLHMGNMIPGISGNKVFLGHSDQTVDFKLKYELVPQMVSTKPKYNDPLRFFTQRENIDYIFVDQEMRDWGVGDLSQRSYLKLVYENPDVEIYQVKR